METRELLRWLSPLIPQKVAQWKNILELADAQSKQFVEHTIITEAKRWFGLSLHDQIVLSLPPKNIANGPIELGTVHYEKEKWPFGLSTNEITSHLCIFGRSGAGKTNCVFEILLQLNKQKVPWIFLDWKKTARHMLPHLSKKTKVYIPGSDFAPLVFNPLLPPPGKPIDSHINQVVDLLASAYTLGDGAKHVLQTALHAVFANEKHPTLEQVKHELDQLATKERQSGWKLSATRAVESLLLGTTKTDRKSQAAFAKTLFKHNTIIELDDLSANMKKFLIPMLCSWIYAAQLHEPSREKLKLVIVFEEAHHVLYRQEHKNQESLMNQLLRQGRELGIGSIIVDQQPSLISSSALANCFASICLNMKNPADMNVARGLSLLPENLKHSFSKLPVGTGIVKLQDRWTEPFLVRLPLVQLRKGSVTDELLGQYATGDLTLSQLRERCGFGQTQAGGSRDRGDACSVDNGRSREFDQVDDEAFSLLQDISAYPGDGVDARYDRLGVSREKGNRWKKALIGSHLVEARRRKVGRAYRLVLVPTKSARSTLENLEGNDPHASLAHELTKQAVAGKLTKNGYIVQLEHPRKNSTGRIDIFATKRKRTIALEIETGMSSVVANVKRDLLERVDQVLIVATDTKASRRVERLLAKEGLIISGRVKILLAIDF